MHDARIRQGARTTSPILYCGHFISSHILLALGTIPKM